MRTWKDHVPADQAEALIEEHDDGSAIFLSSYDGGAAKKGAWGGITLMHINSDGDTTFRRLEAVSGWLPSMAGRQPFLAATE